MIEFKDFLHICCDQWPVLFLILADTKPIFPASFTCTLKFETLGIH